MGSIPEREQYGEMFLCGAFGTCLGVLYENTAYAGVNGRRAECSAVCPLVTE